MAISEGQSGQCTDAAARWVAAAVRRHRLIEDAALRFLSEYTEVKVTRDVMSNQPSRLVDRLTKREWPTAGSSSPENNERKRKWSKQVGYGVKQSITYRPLRSTERIVKAPKMDNSVVGIGGAVGITSSAPAAFSAPSSVARHSSDTERRPFVSPLLPLPPPPPDRCLSLEARAPARVMAPPPPPPSVPLPLHAEHSASGCAFVQRLPLSRFSVAWNAEGGSRSLSSMDGDLYAFESVRTLCVGLPLHNAERCHDCRSAAAWVATRSQSRDRPQGLHPVSSSFFRVGLGEQYLFFVKFANVYEARQAFAELRYNNVYCIWAKQDSRVHRE